MISVVLGSSYHTKVFFYFIFLISLIANLFNAIKGGKSFYIS